MHFIIAADDAALRRHLTAQELGQSGPDGGRENGGGLPEEVRDSVNEYLRKFFGASLRIRELLDEDVREFTAEELRGFFDSRGLGLELENELVEMTSQGLKRNPRRIKQFVNNLQLRLQMLAERREQGRVLLDADVRVVAKLAILEEEFPAEFEQLQAEPALLRAWHAQARSAAEEDSASVDRALASFLRFTDDIQPRDIRAYLNLKQTRDGSNSPATASSSTCSMTATWANWATSSKKRKERRPGTPAPPAATSRPKLEKVGGVALTTLCARWWRSHSYRVLVGFISPRSCEKRFGSPTCHTAWSSWSRPSSWTRRRDTTWNHLNCGS